MNVNDDIDTEIARNRLMIDHKSLNENPLVGLSAAPKDGNFMYWNAVISGLEGTPWDGGTFKLTLVFPEDYPRSPPVVRFVSTVIHPNVYADGYIDLDILRVWNPYYDVAAILLSIQCLLGDPDLNDPANDIAAENYIESRQEYNRRVRETVKMSWLDC